MKHLQVDVKSVPAEAFTYWLIGELENFTGKTSLMSTVLTKLKNWDFIMDEDLVAPTIYRKWRDYLQEYTFGDELASVPYRPSLNLLEKVMTNGSSKWFDDITTISKIENRSDIVIKALNATIEALKDYYGSSEVDTWRWGDIHQVIFTHIAIDSLSKGPYEASGEGYTVNPSRASISDLSNIGYARAGASERMIIDFSDLQNSYSVIPSGERGLSNSVHYSDQLEDLFLQGKYHQRYFYATAEEFPVNHIESQITFLPTQGNADFIIYLSIFIGVGCIAGIAILYIAKKKGIILKSGKSRGGEQT